MLQHTTTDYEFRFDQPESPVILDARPNGLLSGKCYYQWKNQQAIQLTDDLFANDSFCMAGLRTKTIGIYEKGTGRKITCNVEGYPYALIWSAPAKPGSGLCALSRGTSLPAAETDPQQWSQRAAAACLAPGRPGRPPSAQRLSAEAKFGKEMQEPLDRGDCILI